MSKITLQAFMVVRNSKNFSFRIQVSLVVRGGYIPRIFREHQNRKPLFLPFKAFLDLKKYRRPPLYAVFLSVIKSRRQYQKSGITGNA